MSEGNYRAPALEKGLQILEFLSQETEPFALSELARKLGRSRTEIYRMVMMLEHFGYIERTQGERFSLTTKLFDLAMRAPPRQRLLAEALPVMQRLSDQTLQSCHLMVSSGADAVVVARVESPDVLGFSVRLGYRRRLNRSAGGRVIFAFQDELQRARWREENPSDEDKALWQAYELETAEVIAAGVYLSQSPYVDAVTDIAAAITTGHLGTAVAALLIPYIGGRSAKLSLSQAAAATRDAARSISQALG